MRDHTKLRAFELADEVAILTYQITRTFPREEVYGLTSQMRRAAVSAASNIVEGCARESGSEYLRFLTMAFGSLRELHYQVGLSNRLGYLSTEQNTICINKIDEAERVLGALIRSIRPKVRGDQAKPLLPTA
ncbi:MAG: four helix bundle protein [Acidobacteria bacterium]|nr:four helix bundle protein [Acidobacteriota bacterium]